MKTTMIIGFGAGGVAALHQLVEGLIATGSSGHRIIIAEKSLKLFARGLAYGNECRSNILDVDFRYMTATDQLDDFAKWIHATPSEWHRMCPGHKVGGVPFPPRGLFGSYLRAVYERTRKRAVQHGIGIERVRKEVSDIERTSKNGLRITVGKQRIRASQALLCLGHLPSDLSHKLGNSPGYFPNPFSQRRIPPTAEVAIIGSRLSAIDAIRSLSDGGHKGPISVFSRLGLLPAVIGNAKDYPLQFLSEKNIRRVTRGFRRKLSLHQMIRLMRLELEKAEGKALNWSSILNPTGSTHDILAKEIQLAKQPGGRPWQSVMMTIYPLLPMLWRALSVRARHTFLEKYYSIWMTYLGAFPLPNAERILPLLKTKQLQVHGGVLSLSYNKHQRSFTIQHVSGSERGGKKTSVHKSTVKYVIDATGPGYKAQGKGSQLIMALLERGLVTPNPCGGIRVHTKSFNVIDAKGKRVQNLCAVGDLTRGDWFATLDLAQLRTQIKMAVNGMLKE